MRKGLRRIRGAIGMGLTWAAAWFAVGLVRISPRPSSPTMRIGSCFEAATNIGAWLQSAH
jgi:hypothetical protein